MQKWLLRCGLFVVGLVGSGSGLVAYRFSNQVLQPGRARLGTEHIEVIQHPERFGFELTPFAVIADDGVVLQAYAIAPTPTPGTTDNVRRFRRLLQQSPQMRLPQPGEHRGTILMLHGISGIKEHNFAIAERFVTAGFTCISYDSRAHGESGGRFSTYGFREVADASAVLDRAIEQFGHDSLAPFGLFGISFGAAVGLQFIPQTSQIDAAVVVSPFANLDRLVREIGHRRLGRVSVLLVPLISQVTAQRAGFRLNDISPMDTARQISIPVMVVHGSEDGFINIEHGQQVYAALNHPQKVWRVVPDGNHHAVLMQGGDALYRDMVEFFGRELAISD